MQNPPRHPFPTYPEPAPVEPLGKPPPSPEPKGLASALPKDGGPEPAAAGEAVEPVPGAAFVVEIARPDVPVDGAAAGAAAGAAGAEATAAGADAFTGSAPGDAAAGAAGEGVVAAAAGITGAGAGIGAGGNSTATSATTGLGVSLGASFTTS